MLDMQISAAITEKPIFYHIFANIIAIVKNVVSLPMF